MNQSKIERFNPPELFDGEAFGMSQGSLDPASCLIYLSGQVAWDENAAVRGTTHGEQTEFALRNLEVALRSSGARLDDVLHLRVWIRGEMADHLESVVALLRERFRDIRPSMTGVGVASLATPDTLVELEVVARRNPV